MSLLQYKTAKCKSCNKKFIPSWKTKCSVCGKTDIEYCYRCHNDRNGCNYIFYQNNKYRFMTSILFIGILIYTGVRL